MNQGAKVIIELPISMSTLKSFIVTIEDQNFAIPMNTIKLVQWVNKDKIFYKDGYKSVLIENQTIPIFDLADVLGIRRNIPISKKMMYEVFLILRKLAMAIMFGDVEI
jgi:two-component system chemotaxis sensor kinase CheA